jgi:hypothetical protein
VVAAFVKVFTPVFKEKARQRVKDATDWIAENNIVESDEPHQQPAIGDAPKTGK